MEDAILALAELCELEPPETTGQGIEVSSHSEALKTLVELGALTRTSNAETVLCLACDDPHPINVEYVGTGMYRAFCRDAGYQPVRPEQLQRWSVSEEWIVRAIASGLGLRPTSTLPSSAVAYIGRARFGNYRCDLFFGRRLSDRRRFEEAAQTISARGGSAPAILVTCTPLALTGGTAPPRCAIIPLTDALRVSDGEIVLDEGPFDAPLRGPDARFSTGPIGFIFGPGYRSAVVGETEFLFSDKEAQVIEALFNAHEQGLGRLHQNEIKGLVGTNQRVGQLFREHPAYGTLIRLDNQGYYWLDL